MPARTSIIEVTATGLSPGTYYAVVTPLTGAGTGTLTGTYPGRPLRETITYHGNDHATTIDDGTATVTEMTARALRAFRGRDQVPSVSTRNKILRCGADFMG